MRPVPDPTPGDPIPGIYSNIADHEKRLHSIESSLTPQTFKDFPLPWKNWKDVAASYQTVYSSVQAFKLDLETVAVTTDGLNVLGAQIIKSPLASLVEMPASMAWEWLLERSDPNRFRGKMLRLFAPDASFIKYKTEIAARLSGHDRAIATLVRGQSTLASTTARDTQSRSNRAAARADTLQGQRGQRRAALGHRADADQLERAAEALRRVGEEADSLARELAGSGS